MIHHGGLTCLCWRQGRKRKRKRIEYIEGDDKAVRGIDVGEDCCDEKGGKEYSRRFKQAKVENDESKGKVEDASNDDNIDSEVAENKEDKSRTKGAQFEEDEIKEVDIDMADDDNIDGEVAENEEDLRATISGQRLRMM